MKTTKGEIISRNFGFKTYIGNNLYVKKADKQSLFGLLDDLFKTKDVTALNTKLTDFFTKSFGIYLSGILLGDILKEKQSILGVKSLDERDTNLLDNVLGSNILWDSYANVGQEATKRINSILALGIQQKKSNAQIKQEILNQVKQLTKFRAETIIRNERNNIQNLTRETIYNDIAPNGLFFMQGPDDSRTAEVTKRVKRRIGKGKTIEQIKQIIREEADPKTYREDRPYQIHINTRHRIAKVV